MDNINDLIIPIELEETLNSLEYEEGGLIFCSLEQIDFDLIFTFKLELNDYESITYQSWQLKIKEFKNYRIHFNTMDVNFQFFSTHFLIDELFEQNELYYNGIITDFTKLYFEISNFHKKKLNGLIEVDRLINDFENLSINKYSSGLFARGPKSILDNYFDILNNQNLKPHYLNKKTNNETEKNSFIIGLLGDNYFIGKEFKFIKLEN